MSKRIDALYFAPSFLTDLLPLIVKKPDKYSRGLNLIKRSRIFEWHDLWNYY